MSTTPPGPPESVVTIASLSPQCSKRKPESPQDPNRTPAKRTKSSHSNATTFHRHSKFWAADGSVLLQIGFERMKVHKSRLSSQSEWFDKLFASRMGLSLKDDEDETDITDVKVEDVDGVELFYLDPTGVTLADFENLLSAMDEGIDFYHLKPPFMVVAAIFRAASTFRFKKYLKFATQFLEVEFSDRLEDVTPIRSLHAAEAVILGRDWDLPRILKCAFYELARASGFAQASGDVNSSDQDGDDGDEDATVDHPVHALQQPDLVRLINLQKRLMQSWLEVLAFPPLKCGMPTPCPVGKYSKNWEIVHSSGIAQKYQFDPICGLQKLIDMDWKKKGYCSACQGTRVRWLAARRAKIWEEMDTWLDLDS